MKVRILEREREGEEEGEGEGEHWSNRRSSNDWECGQETDRVDWVGVRSRVGEKDWRRG